MKAKRHRSRASIRLDSANACLWRGARRITLRPKDFAILCYLVERPGQLVSKAELFEAVWPDTFVTETVLKACMHRIRLALRDQARAPRFIETVHRRGYRFIGKIPAATGPATLPDTRALSSPARRASPQYIRATGRSPWLVGRESALACLQHWLEQACEGERRIGFVTGEVGIGKTTVVDAFLEDVAVRGGVWVIRGQCVEQYGAGEPYLPVLEALSRFCREPGHELCMALLRRYAPAWLFQMPWLLSPAEREALQGQSLGATRERMLREMTEAVVALAVEAPLVLVLEDLHWSDYASLDLLAALARQREPVRLLLVGTYRPEDVASAHPLHALTLTLRLQRRCEELPLNVLSAEEIEGYVVARFRGLPTPAELAQALHQHTEGNPLFMVNLVEHLLVQGWLQQRGAQWALQEGWEHATGEVSETLRELVVHRSAALSQAERRVLEAAGVAGVEFSAAVVAAGLGADVVETEAWCEGLRGRGQFLRSCGIDAWPDGTVAARYGFLHALYQQVVYQGVPAARRTQLHRRIGEREAAGYGGRAGELAGRLAMHFERGGDHARAVQYHGQAAQNALGRCGYREAIGHATRGLALLTFLPDTPERTAHELALHIALGLSLAATQGYAAPATEQAYARARALCQQVGDTHQLFPVLLGLWAFYLVRGAIKTSQELAEPLLFQAQQTDDPLRLVWAHAAAGMSLIHRGELVHARTHLDQGLAYYDRQQHRAYAALIQPDPGVACPSYLSWTLCLLGYPDQAVRKSHEAIALARDLEDPFSLAYALIFAAHTSICRREVRAAGDSAQAALALATEQGVAYWQAVATMQHGWAMALQGQGDRGIAQIRQGLAAWRTTGAELSRSFWYALQAEAYASVGQAAEAVRLLDDALKAIDTSGEHWWEAEVYRLKGELLLRQGVPDELQAEVCLRRALQVARRQQARAFELRTALHLSQLWHRRGRHKAARRLLAEVYGWFREGFDTADLKEARALLALWHPAGSL